MKKKEIFIIAFAIFFVGIGIILDKCNQSVYRVYVREDGIIEWLSVIFLAGCAFSCFSRAYKLMKCRDKLFIILLLIYGLVFIFGIGEEISWGQRIFGFESTDFFKGNNSQREFNIHNLKIGDVKINKLLFGKILGVFMISYLLVIPWLHRKKNKLILQLNRFAIPIPHLYQGIFFLSVALLINILEINRKGELIEFTGCIVFFLAFYFPVNYQIFEVEEDVFRF